MLRVSTEVFYYSPPCTQTPIHKKKSLFENMPGIRGNALRYNFRWRFFFFMYICAAGYECADRIECLSIAIKSHATLRSVILPSGRTSPLPERVTEYFISRPIRCFKENTSVFLRDLFFSMTPNTRYFFTIGAQEQYHRCISFVKHFSPLRRSDFSLIGA